MSKASKNKALADVVRRIEDGPPEIVPHKAGKRVKPEVRIHQVIRFLIHGRTTQEIAQAFGLGERQTQKLVKQARDLLRVDPKTLEVNAYVGETLAYFHECRSLAMRLVMAKDASVSQKLDGIRTALKAQDYTNRFLKDCVGLYAPEIRDRFVKVIVDAQENPSSNDAEEQIRIAEQLGGLVELLGREMHKPEYATITEAA